MTRAFNYPLSIPPLETPIVNEQGRLTDPWRRWFEGVQIQAGGQGGDALFDAVVQGFVEASEARAFAEGVERLTRLVQDQSRINEASIEQAAQESRREIRQLSDSVRAEIESALAGLGNLSRNDLLAPQFAVRGLAGVQQTNSIGRESMMTPTIPNTNPVMADFETRQIFTSTSVGNEPVPQLPDATVNVRFFYEFEATADIFDWYYWRVRISRETIAGTTLSTIYDGNRLWNVSQATNGASGNAASNAYPISRGETIEVFDVLPSSSIYPGYIYRARLDPIPSPGDPDRPVEGFNKATTRIFDCKQRTLIVDAPTPRVTI